MGKRGSPSLTSQRSGMKVLGEGQRFGERCRARAMGQTMKPIEWLAMVDVLGEDVMERAGWICRYTFGRILFAVVM